MKEKIIKCRSSNQSSLPQLLRYNRYLHQPQLHILLTSLSGNMVDIHIFRKEDNNNIPGLLYIVTTEGCIKGCFNSNIIPDGLLCKDDCDETRQFHSAICMIRRLRLIV